MADEAHDKPQGPDGADAPGTSPEPANAASPQEGSAATPAEDALESVEQAADAVASAVADAPGAGRSSNGTPVDLPVFGGGDAGPEGTSGMNLLNGVALRVTLELGRTRMFVEDVLRLNADSVIELDKAAGDPVDIYVNDRHVARGEVLVLNENFCVRVSEIVRPGKPEN